MEAIGTLAGGIAHDFNNMLAIILGNAEIALDDLQGGDGPGRNIEHIIKASKRARDLVRQILAFGRKNEGAKQPLQLAPLMQETYKLLRGVLPSTVRMHLDIRTESATVLADPSQVQEVLMNLATNAAHAMRDNGGILTIGLSTVAFNQNDPRPDPDMSPGTYVKLSVQDTGTGMTEEVRRRIFEPFFTTKELGTGMGLAVVYGIVKGHGGAVTTESKMGEGSTFTIFLSPTEARAIDERIETGDIPGGKERILLVDDDPAVTEMTAVMLRRLGYQLTTAESGGEAWDIFAGAPGSFDLVITDQTMPDLTGRRPREKDVAGEKGDADHPVYRLQRNGIARRGKKGGDQGVRHEADCKTGSGGNDTAGAGLPQQEQIVITPPPLSLLLPSHFVSFSFFCRSVDRR